ncbi:MAG: hypothetical protein Q4D29_13780, partial [Lachnospiraceae bacterium]|nr:hypothetical protein [Lachnospiraceae bacterium]
MENKLILHIGMPKTGTSAIQGFLYDNRDRLNKYNISYPDLIEDMTKRGYVVATRPEGRTKNGVSLNHFRSWDNMECISPAVITEWNVYTDLINSYLKDSSVIISDEDLWCQGNNYVLIRELKKICSNIEIIVYLRRQDLEIEAIWNQVVKRYGYCSLDFKDARERWENDRLVSYFEILSNIEKIVGLENMNIRVYEKS